VTNSLPGQYPLRGKAALITGGSRGIGRAIALGLASHGAAIVIGYLRNDAQAREVVKTITDAGGNAAAVQANLSRPAEVTRLFDEAEQRVGALDIVVANAADIMVKPLADCSEEDYDRIFDTNTKGVFFILKEAARRLNDGGRIIVSSTGGTKMFFPGQSLYLGSKGAVEQFVRALSWELGGRGITVNAISPGPTDTDMMQDRYRDAAAEKSPFNRIGDPRDVADVAVFLATDAARWVTGQNIGAGGGAF
jgi:3-oxoacyl-[acyl-carrier protein] reductase